MHTFLTKRTFHQGSLLRVARSFEQAFPVFQKSPLARKLGAFVAVPDDDLATLDRLHQRRRSFVVGVDLVHQGQANQTAFMLAKGWVCSYKILHNVARQIVASQVPGDAFGLSSVHVNPCVEAIARNGAFDISKGPCDLR